jgi:predicted RecA/RadA family phage recombinase
MPVNNFINEGRALQFTASGNVASGQGVVIGSVLGVATDAVANGNTGAALIVGRVRLPKASGAINAGVKLIWDHTAGNLKTSGATTGNLSNAAIAASGAASGDATVEVILNPFFSTVA